MKQMLWKVVDNSASPLAGLRFPCISEGAPMETVDDFFPNEDPKATTSAATVELE